MQDQNQNYPRLSLATRSSNDEAVPRLLANKQFQEIMKYNQNLSEKIKRAAELLIDTLDPESALSVAVKAIRKDTINVFVSYKKQDEDAARTVVKELRKYGGKHLNIEYMADFSESTAGEEFNKKIRQSIKEAHWFILLLPDPSVDWDWCLFETGMFRGRMLEKVHKLFCLHHPNQTDLPPQINEFQAVSSEPDIVEGFLRRLFINPDPIPGMDPISPHIEDDLNEITSNIINAIKPRNQRINRKFLDKYILLSTRNLKNPDTYENKDKMFKDMYGMEILEIKSDTLSIFGMIEKPQTWGELVSKIPSADQVNDKWLLEIHASIRKVLKMEAFGPIQATFKGRSSGKLWRPCLSAVDRTTNGTIESVLVVFVEEIAAGLTAHIPPSSLALMTAVRFTYRFRWEILKRYGYSLSENEITEMKDGLDRIETEARSRGLLDKDKIIALFSNDLESANRVNLMFDTWKRIRNNERTGELDIAIKESDVEKIKLILCSVSKINQEFLELAITRMEAMISSDA